MSSFKTGSGDLDFGSTDGDEEEQETNETAETTGESQTRESKSSEQSTSATTDKESSDPVNPPVQAESHRESSEESDPSISSSEEYPYFIRRNNVGDERDTRLEIHVRDKVAEQESEFRNELAELLDTSEVSKTDAREFALLAAFHHPKRVAELMRAEGFGTLN